MKAGLLASAPTLAIASSRVASGFGLAGCLKPMWLSEICRKLNPCAACALAAEIPSSEDDRGTPPAIVHSTPVPAQIMHSSAPRRSRPSLSSCAIPSLLPPWWQMWKRRGEAAVYSQAIRKRLRGPARPGQERQPKALFPQGRDVGGEVARFSARQRHVRHLRVRVEQEHCNLVRI